MTETDGPYPDISDILARKAAGRRERAKLTFAEKLDALEELRARVEPIRQARVARERRRRHGIQNEQGS